MIRSNSNEVWEEKRSILESSLCGAGYIMLRVRHITRDTDDFAENDWWRAKERVISRW